MADLEQLLAERIAKGLSRKAVTTCSKWAESYRMMPSANGSTPWTFDHFPWTRAMHDCDEELAVGQKAAQMGFTEMCLNRCFYAIDIEGTSVLYVLPTEGDSSDFSTSRFDPALELSEHLRLLFSDVKNVGLKRAGGSCLFVRGSKSKSKLKSVPAGQMFFDEVDEMDQANITLAFERMSGQIKRQAWMISTPTISGKGINRFYEQSTQEHFFFKCPSCNRQTELVFPECLVITGESANDPRLVDSHIVCKECKALLPHEGKPEMLKSGIWVPGKSDRLTVGYHVNQLYSCRLEPWKIAQLWLNAQTNPTDEQEFYNSKMGVTHAVKGAQLTEKDVEDAIGGYQKQQVSPNGSFITMGVDVGSWIHYEIDQYTFSKARMTNDINLLASCRVLTEGKVRDFEELDILMRQYNVLSCVIDNQPDTRKALEFANRFHGRVHLCIYGNGTAGKNVKLHTEEPKVTVDRTNWLDVSLGRYRNNSIKLPVDVSQEYKTHMTAPIRVYKRDQNGNPYGVYESVKDDHFAHARNYAEIALQVGVEASGSQDMESPI